MFRDKAVLSFLCALTLTSSAFAAASDTAAAKKSAKASRAAAPNVALCKTALGATGPQQKEVDAFVESGLILSAVHAEAILKAAATEKLLIHPDYREGGYRNEEHTFDISKESPGTKDQLRKMSRFLEGTDERGNEARENFAEAVLVQLEKTVLAVKEGHDTLQRLKAFDVRKDTLYFSASLRPTAENLESAWMQLNDTLKKPGGRELLKKTLVAANGPMTRVMARFQHTGTKVIPMIIGSVLATGTGAYFGFGPESPILMFGSTVLGTWGLSAGTYSLSEVKRPWAALRMKLFRSAEKKRIHALIAKAKTDGVIDPSLATGAMDSLEDLPTSAAIQIFDREMVSAQTEELKSIVPKVESKDFEGTSNFGAPIIGRVDQALDTMALMSKRMSLLEADIDKLASVIAGGELKITPEQATVLVQRALESSGEVVLDGARLVDYSRALLEKIDEHVNFAQVQIQKGDYSTEASLELADVRNELLGIRELLEPQARLLPVMMKVARDQRSILRNLRTNLRGRKIESSESMSNLVDAITKLKKISESATKDSSK